MSSPTNWILRYIKLTFTFIESDECEPTTAGPEVWSLHSVGVSRVEVPQSFPRAGHGGNGKPSTENLGTLQINKIYIPGLTLNFFGKIVPKCTGTDIFEVVYHIVFCLCVLF